MKLLDTGFLIDLQREWSRGKPGPAQQFLAAQENDEFRISVVTTVEFLEGFPQAADGERFLEPFPELEVTVAIARAGSRLRRDLRRAGEMIGDFEILIAATALATGMPLVTDSARHFERVEGLAVESYRDNRG